MIDLEQPATTNPPAKKPLWSTVLMVALLAAAVGGIAYLLVFSPPVSESGLALDHQQAPTTTVANQDVAFPATDEPIADAAQVILPSVVQIQTDSGVGSGVIYDSSGLILTAGHVVKGSTTVRVKFADGQVVEGTVVGEATDADVGVVRVNRTGLTPATLALGETPRVGQLAIAVGSPWGLQSTVTAGIVSAVNQPIDCSASGACRSMLQTDAAINPGNSGGALVDRFGRVLGINVSIFTLSGANDGVGFAVPIDVAHDIATRLVSGQILGTAFLGVSGGDAESGRAGALIAEVTRGSGADVGGVLVGDLVVSIDGVEVQGIADLASQVRTHQPGASVVLVVLRGSEEVTLSIILGELPAN
jgi:S1-C subfamily serine protease